MKVQIVIPAINLWEKYTKQCINTTMDAMMRAKAHGIDCHLLLIDNASTDNTSPEASKMVSDLFAHQRNEERWGFQKSVNFGVKYGIEHETDLIFVCNNDIVLHPESIWRLVERFGKDQPGMVTCMDITKEMQDESILPINIGTINANDKAICEDTPHPNFSAFMISKQAWEITGEFDELFFPAYYEDNDYHYRMQLLEIPAITYPPAMFYHYASRTQFEAQEDGKPLATGNNKQLYIDKWGATPGNELFKTPYNDPNKSIQQTKQNGSL